MKKAWDEMILQEDPEEEEGQSVGSTWRDDDLGRSERPIGFLHRYSLIVEATR